jgi:uncharacterized protein YkwD
MRRPTSVTGRSVLLLLLLLASPTYRAHAAWPAGATSAPEVARDKPPSQGYVYTVRPRDTVWGIAAAHGISAADLIASNDLADPRVLQTGQTLFVPAPPPAAQKNSATAAADAAQAPQMETSPGPAPNPNPEASALPPDVLALLGLINGKRAAVGLPPLAWSPQLAQAAQLHAQDCAKRDRGSHSGSDGATLETRLARAGTTPRWASENWANAQNAQHAFTIWWNETPGRDPHRRNILDPRYREIGIGIAPGPWGVYFIADFAGR